MHRYKMEKKSNSSQQIAKRLIRIIYHLTISSSITISSSTRQRFNGNHRLNIFQVKSLQVVFFTHKYSNRLLPTSSFRNVFVRSSDLHSHGTRSSSDLRSDPARTTLQLFSMSSLAVQTGLRTRLLPLPQERNPFGQPACQIIVLTLTAFKAI